MVTRDCVHSIFWFLSLADLAAVQSTSTGWQNDVATLPVRGFKRMSFRKRAGYTEMVTACLRSPLWKQVTHVEIRTRPVLAWDEMMFVESASLISHSRSLTSLDLFESGCGFAFDAAYGFKLIMSAVGRNQNLAMLNIGGNGISSASHKEFALALTQNHRLVDLNLSRNLLGDNEIKVLLPNLSHTLTSLNLGKNEISDESSDVLASFLGQSRALRTLNLGNNLIGDKSIESIVAVLTRHSCLTSLELHNNEIGDPGAIALASFVSSSRTLTSLDIRRNEIGPDGAKTLAAAVMQSQSLVFLDLSHNIAGDVGIMAFVQTMRHTTLVRLNLGGNRMSNLGRWELENAYQDQHSTRVDRSSKLILDLATYS